MSRFRSLAGGLALVVLATSVSGPAMASAPSWPSEVRTDENWRKAQEIVRLRADARRMSDLAAQASTIGMAATVVGTTAVGGLLVASLVFPALTLAVPVAFALTVGVGSATILLTLLAGRKSTRHKREAERLTRELRGRMTFEELGWLLDQAERAMDGANVSRSAPTTPTGSVVAGSAAAGVGTRR